MVSQLLKILLVVMWEHIPVVGDALARKTEASERLAGNNAGSVGLLLSCIALQRDNKQLESTY